MPSPTSGVPSWTTVLSRVTFVRTIVAQAEGEKMLLPNVPFAVAEFVSDVAVPAGMFSA